MHDIFILVLTLVDSFMTSILTQRCLGIFDTIEVKAVTQLVKAVNVTRALFFQHFQWGLTQLIH